jgi:hypothetical protein
LASPQATLLRSKTDSVGPAAGMDKNSPGQTSEVSNEENIGMQWLWDNLSPKWKPPQATLPQSIADSIRMTEVIDPTPPQYRGQAREDSDNLQDERIRNVESTVRDLQEELSTANDLRFEQEEINKKLQKRASELEAMIKTLKYNVETENAAKLEKLEEGLDSLQSKFEDRENDEVDAVDDEEEPAIALEDQLRITEQSAKAIDLLSNHLLSTVWQPCSQNTFGNENKWILLCNLDYGDFINQMDRWPTTLRREEMRGHLRQEEFTEWAQEQGGGLSGLELREEA